MLSIAVRSEQGVQKHQVLLCSFRWEEVEAEYGEEQETKQKGGARPALQRAGGGGGGGARDEVGIVRLQSGVECS